MSWCIYSVYVLEYMHEYQTYVFLMLDRAKEIRKSLIINMTDINTEVEQGA